MNIETILRDIGADKARCSGETFHDPSLRMLARLAAQATVRVFALLTAVHHMTDCGFDASGHSNTGVVRSIGADPFAPSPVRHSRLTPPVASCHA